MYELLKLYITATTTLVSMMGENPSYINRQSNYSYPSDNVISVNYQNINTILYPAHYIQTYPAKIQGGGLIQQQIKMSTTQKTGGQFTQISQVQICKKTG